MVDKIRVRVIVSGRVRGVFFRQNTLYMAKEIGVFGFVINLPDGRVEAVFEGGKEKVEKMIEWMKEGPKYAQVDGCEINFEKYKGEFNGFEIRY